MILSQWKNEPEKYRTLGRCRDITAIVPLLQKYATFSPRIDKPVLWCKQPSPSADGKGAHMVLLYLDVPRNLFIVNWMLQQAGQWEVFYQVVADDLNPNESKIDPPRGEFLPWGYRAETEARAADDVLHIVERDCTSIPISATFGDTAELEAQIAPRHLSKSEVKNGIPLPEKMKWNLDLRVVRSRELPRHDDQARLEQIRREIGRLNAMADRLEWRLVNRHTDAGGAQFEPVMYVYYEQRAESLQDWNADRLRKWLATAPSSAIEEYQHARLSVWVQRGDNVQPLHHLHVVLPRSETPPKWPLPGESNRLRRDRRWHSLGQHVFVPEGYELWPHPPKDGKLKDLMIKALWPPGKTKRYLVLLPTPSTIGDDFLHWRTSCRRELFQPLSEQQAAFNVEVAGVWASELVKQEETPLLACKASLVEPWYEAFVESVVDQLRPWGDELEKTILDAWDKADYERETGKLVEQAAEFKKLLDQLAEQRGDLYAAWNKVWKRVHDAHHHLVTDTDTKVCLEQLTRVETSLAEPTADRADLARRLRDLADKLDARSPATERGQ